MYSICISAFYGFSVFMNPLCGHYIYGHIPEQLCTHENHVVVRSLQEEAVLILVQQWSLSLRKVLTYPGKSY